jgi:hypothetical protein
MAEADHLRRLAYLMLAPSLGRRRRLDLADAAGTLARDAPDPTAALVGEVLRSTAGRTGLVLFERHGMANRQLAALPPAARVAYVLNRVEGLPVEETVDVLRAAGVSDPETALALSAKSPLDPAVAARVELPAHGGPRAAQLVAVAAAALAVGVAVPVVAVTTTGHEHATDTGVWRPLGSPTTPAPRAQPATPSGMAAVLGSLLAKIDARMKNDTDPVDRQKLQTLREAVAAKLAQLPR